MPPPYELHSSVILEAQRIFKKENIKTILKGLSETELWAENSGPVPRIHIAILWSSKGKMDLFKQRLEWASSDWRDLLVETGLGNENWCEVLKSKGIDASTF